MAGLIYKLTDQHLGDGVVDQTCVRWGPVEFECPPEPPEVPETIVRPEPPIVDDFVWVPYPPSPGHYTGILPTYLLPECLCCSEVGQALGSCCNPEC